MTIYKDQVFEGEAMILEECVFIRCELKDCHLFYSGGDFNMVDSKISNCQIHTRGPAMNTVKLLEFMGTLPRKIEPPPASPLVQ